MNFEFTEEQEMLRSTLAAFLQNRAPFEARRAIVKSDSGFAPSIWKSFAIELGIVGAPFPEALGGLGGCWTDNLIIMEELGKALSLEPWLESVVMAGSLLRGGGNAADELLRAVITGDALVIPAMNLFPDARTDPRTAVQVKRVSHGYTLSGLVPLVRNAVRATHLIVRSNSSDEHSQRLFIVPVENVGLSAQSFAMVDGSRWSAITLEDVSVPDEFLIAEGEHVSTRMEDAFDMGVAALCAESLGIQQRLLSWTVDYAKQRKQFGRPIAEFQVLQHRMAEMFIKVEESTSMVYMLTARLAEPPAQRAKYVSAAKVRIDQCGRFVGEASVQIHGGMGISRELPIADYFSRIIAISQQLASTEDHFRRYEAAAFARS